MIVTGSSRSTIRPRPRRPRTTTPPSRAGTPSAPPRYVETIQTELPDGGEVGFLVWGDPAFYDSTIRIAAGPRRPGSGRRSPRRSRHQQPPAARRRAPDRAQPDRAAGARDHRPPAAGGVHGRARRRPRHARRRPGLRRPRPAASRPRRSSGAPSSGCPTSAWWPAGWPTSSSDIQRERERIRRRPRLGARHLPAPPTLTDPASPAARVARSCSSSNSSRNEDPSS